jgi:Biotin/lipoate A/B protein ligase family
MTLPQRTRLRTNEPRLDLPPPFRCVSLREVGDAFAHAVSVAEQEGAGTLVHVGRFDLVEFALVLEPEEPLRSARRALYAGLVALGHALAVHAPPQRLITFEWPDAIRVDRGLVGGVRLGWPQDSQESEAPDWLVFAAMIRTVALGEEDPGLRPLSTALEQEGFDDLGSGRLVETFARSFMRVMDTWQAEGFGPIEKEFLARLHPETGIRYELTGNGDLLMHRPEKPETKRKSLKEGLRHPSRLDPATGGPPRQ